MRVKAFITHKRSEEYADCADYYRVDPKTHRIAVSDGISQSLMPFEWARILVSAYCDGTWKPGNDISTIQREWLTGAHNYLNEQKAEGKNNWLLEDGLAMREGAGATFCGIEFSESKEWNACILGDSCLITINSNNLIDKIYSSKEGAIDNRPDYFDSFGSWKGEIRRISGKMNKSEKLFIVSDPFSELLQKVKSTDKENHVISLLQEVSDQTEFVNTVETLRDSFGMHNDDSTFIIIESDDSSDIEVIYEKPIEELIIEEKSAKEKQNNKQYNEGIEYDLLESFSSGNTIIGQNKASSLDASNIVDVDGNLEKEANGSFDNQQRFDKYQTTDSGENSLIAIDTPKNGSYDLLGFKGLQDTALKIFLHKYSGKYKKNGKRKKKIIEEVFKEFWNELGNNIYKT